MAFPANSAGKYEGLGEPIFEHDLQGADMVKEIMKEPYAEERLEMFRSRVRRSKREGLKMPMRYENLLA